MQAPTPKNLSDTHILKIVLKGKTFNPNVGIRCSPRQTYGVSEQSPDQFKLTHSIIAQNGYIYNDQQDRENRNQYFPYFNQRKFCSVVGNTIDVVQQSRDVYMEEYNKSPKRFNKRKGRLTDFMDKNGWMNNVYKMMGFQRSDQARQALYKDLQKKVKSARKPIFYNNPVQKKVSLPKQSYINSQLITQKAKIRLQRLTLQKQKKSDLDIQKQMIVTSKKSPQKDMYMDAQNLTNKMSSTANQKQWRSTMATIRRKFRKQIDQQDKKSLTRSDWAENIYNKSSQMKPQTSYHSREIFGNKDQLNQWANTTCNSGADRWKFVKKRKITSISDQQILD